MVVVVVVAAVVVVVGAMDVDVVVDAVGFVGATVLPVVDVEIGSVVAVESSEPDSPQAARPKIRIAISQYLGLLIPHLQSSKKRPRGELRSSGAGEVGVSLLHVGANRLV